MQAALSRREPTRRSSHSSLNVIGPGNLISGNAQQGISITGSSATSNVVKGNLIGTDAAGASALGNGGDGVLIFNGASSNTIGGLGPGDFNVISGNQFGMSISGATTSGNVVLGNFIGSNAIGTAAIGNATHAINLNTGTFGNIIGGTAAGASNVIGGNANGILVLSGAHDNAILGNRIGLGAIRTPLPNTGNGIYVDTGTSNVIGGTASTAFNIIAFNTGAGVFIANGTGNAIRGNSVHDNSGLGIDLAGGGVTLNDAGDTDTGANNLQNFPVLTQALATATITSVSGTLNSAASTSSASMSSRTLHAIRPAMARGSCTWVRPWSRPTAPGTGRSSRISRRRSVNS